MSAARSWSRLPPRERPGAWSRCSRPACHLRPRRAQAGCSRDRPLREALGQKPLAFTPAARLPDAPKRPGVREELERLAADTGSFEELAAAYEDQLDRRAPPSRWRCDL